MAEKWIKKTEMKKGALHRHLHIPDFEEIPTYALEKLSNIPIDKEFTYHDIRIKMTGKLKREVTLALTFRRMHK